MKSKENAFFSKQLPSKLKKKLPPKILYDGSLSSRWLKNNFEGVLGIDSEIEKNTNSFNTVS